MNDITKHVIAHIFGAGTITQLQVLDAGDAYELFFDTGTVNCSIFSVWLFSTSRLLATYKSPHSGHQIFANQSKVTVILPKELK